MLKHSSQVEECEFLSFFFKKGVKHVCSQIKCSNSWMMYAYSKNKVKTILNNEFVLEALNWKPTNNPKNKCSKYIRRSLKFFIKLQPYISVINAPADHVQISF